MAGIFEPQKGNSVLADDTHPLTCVLDQSHMVKDHTEYIIKVQRSGTSEDSWTVSKRYNDFVALDTTLKIANIVLPFPPKKVFGNMDREFILERQKGLQVYMNELQKYHWLANSLPVRQFLNHKNYQNCSKLSERGLQHISLLFRSDLRWEVQEPLLDIGWRIRKEYFSAKDKDRPKSKFILSWCPLGPLCMLGERDLTSFLKLLTTLQHPYIEPISAALLSEDNCACTIQQYYEKGSLRDLICKAKTKSHFLKKYAHPKAVAPLPIEAIKLFGRQILEAIKFLHEKGLPYGHLHAGNVVVEDNNKTCRLLGIENFFVGVPSLHKAHFIQFKKIQSLEQVDVYCFGHLVYEMAFGEILNAPSCDFLPVNCHPDVRSLLESILSSSALRETLPSIGDLLLHKLFGDVRLPVFEKPQFRLPSKLKDVLAEAKSKFESRLHSEQNQIYQQKRLSKATDFYMSEEEKRRRRRSKLKQKSSDEGVRDRTQSSEDQPVESASRASGVISPTVNGALEASTDPADSNPAPSSPQEISSDRGALLSSIQNFNKQGLKRSATVDGSQNLV